MKRTSDLVTFGGNRVTLLGKQMLVGSNAKNFIGIGVDLKPISLSDFQGKVRIISSVPSIDTGVCAAQTRRFNQEAANLDNVLILSVSCDLPFALNRFCAAEGIEQVITISDYRDTDFGIKYGFLIQEYRLLARGVIVVDPDDTIRYMEIVREINNEPAYEKALNVVKELT